MVKVILFDYDETLLQTLNSKIPAQKDSEFRKPDPRVFEPLCKKTETIDVAKNEIVYVGDDIRDFEAAKGAGIHFIAISDHTTASEIFNF